jgi:YHS domain-containing protein
MRCEPVKYYEVMVMATDPVCLAIVDEDDAKFTAVHKKEKYYFCCNYCKKQFQENPKRYSRLSHDVSFDLKSCQ